jgi:O-antigen/teichoic acid export membrane protein
VKKLAGQLAELGGPLWIRQGTSILWGRGGDALLRLGLFLATARVLAPRDYSFYALITAALATSQTIFSFGAPRTAMFLHARGHRSRLFAWLLAAATAGPLLVGIGLTASPGLRRLLFPDLAPHLLLIGLAPLPFLLLSDSLSALLLSQGRNRLYSTLLWSRTLATAAVLAASLFSADRLEFLLLGRILVNFAAAAFVSIAIPLRPAWRGLARFGRSALAYGLPVAAAGTLFALHRRADVFLLSAFGRTPEIGAYAIAFVMAEAFWILSDSLEAALFVDLAKREDAAAQIEVARALRIYWICGAVVFSLGLAAGETAALLLFGRRYPDVALLFPFALLAAVIWGASRPFLSYLYSRGLSRQVLTAHGAGLAMNILLCLALIPAWGARGAVAASCVSYSAEVALLAFLFGRHSRRGQAPVAAEAS